MVDIILADHLQLVRSSLKTLLLGTSGELHIIEARTFEEALILLRRTKALYLIVDMSAEDDPENIKRALEMEPALKILVLADQFDLGLVYRTYAQGAGAFLLKECLYDELVLAMKCVGAERYYLCSGTSARLLESTNRLTWEKGPFSEKYMFTDRELEVLELIAEGRTNLEISEQLFLSKRTVEGHRQSLLHKTNSRNSAQLVRLAVRNHIIH